MFDLESVVVFRSSVGLPLLAGAGIVNAVQAAGREIRHAQEMRGAQSWVDHLSASTRAANEDFRAVVAELAQARSMIATLQAELDCADEENLELSLLVRELGGIH